MSLASTMSEESPCRPYLAAGEVLKRRREERGGEEKRGEVKRGERVGNRGEENEDKDFLHVCKYVYLRVRDLQGVPDLLGV